MAPHFGASGVDWRFLTTRSEAELKPILDAYNQSIQRDYDDKGQYSRAIRDYSKAIRLNPKDAWSYINRGIVFRKTGKIDLAMSPCTLNGGTVEGSGRVGADRWSVDLVAADVLTSHQILDVRVRRVDHQVRVRPHSC